MGRYLPPPPDFASPPPLWGSEEHVRALFADTPVAARVRPRPQPVAVRLPRALRRVHGDPLRPDAEGARAPDRRGPLGGVPPRDPRDGRAPQRGDRRQPAHAGRVPRGSRGGRARRRCPDRSSRREGHEAPSSSRACWPVDPRPSRSRPGRAGRGRARALRCRHDRGAGRQQAVPRHARDGRADLRLQRHGRRLRVEPRRTAGEPVRRQRQADRDALRRPHLAGARRQQRRRTAGRRRPPSTRARSPWLLLSAASTTAGPDGDRLARTTYIQRLATTGGLSPAAATCNADTAGSQAEVPYTADYYFWK